MILGEKRGKRRSIQSEDLFFLENGMILGEKYEKRRSIQSEDLFFFFFFQKKITSARSKYSVVFREHQFLRILALGP